MSQNETTAKTYEDGLRDAAAVCHEASVRLLNNGKRRVNQIDRHTADVLESMRARILLMGESAI